MVSEPPNDRLTPPKLTLEFANFEFAIEPANWAFVIVPDNDDVG